MPRTRKSASQFSSTGLDSSPLSAKSRSKKSQNNGPSKSTSSGDDTLVDRNTDHLDEVQETGSRVRELSIGTTTEVGSDDVNSSDSDAVCVHTGCDLPRTPNKKPRTSKELTISPDPDEMSETEYFEVMKNRQGYAGRSQKLVSKGQLKITATPDEPVGYEWFKGSRLNIVNIDLTNTQWTNQGSSCSINYINGKKAREQVHILLLGVITWNQLKIEGDAKEWPNPEYALLIRVSPDTKARLDRWYDSGPYKNGHPKSWTTMGRTVKIGMKLSEVKAIDGYEDHDVDSPFPFLYDGSFCSKAVRDNKPVEFDVKYLDKGHQVAVDVTVKGYDFVKSRDRITGYRLKMNRVFWLADTSLDDLETEPLETPETPGSVKRKYGAGTESRSTKMRLDYDDPSSEE